MKTEIIVLIAFVFVLTTNASIWRVSKDATYLPHFSEIQVAIDSASVGDTIYVYPGSYNNIAISKLITIIGSGYFHIENTKDSLTRITTDINIHQINFNKGSDYSSLIGMAMHNSGHDSGGLYIESANNIALIGNRITSLVINNSNLINIQRNYITGRTYRAIDGGNSKNLIFSNNIIHTSLGFDGNSDVILKNNYIGGDVNVTNSMLENNILMGQNFSISSSWEQYNVFKTGCNLATISGKSTFATYQEVFPTNPAADNFQLLANSAAKGKGNGGVDCGPFGGLQPYCLSGVLAIPSIVSLYGEPQVSAESGLKVRVKVKSNRP
mgnify:CR=1 FL=1